MSDELPTGRLRRGLTLVKLAAKELPLVGERVLAGSFRERDLQQLKTSAEEAAKVLGDLKGLALKVGQTVSYVDGLLPPQATEVYQKALAKLQSGAPTVSFEQMRVEIERGLGRSLEDAFVAFEEKPIAAASIGQVHRARLKDEHGEVHTVAVKVQYPGIAQALGSDLKNLEVLGPVISMLAPGADTKGGMQEVVTRLAEELDYELEGRNQDRFRKVLEPYPDVVIPKVHWTHCGKNVLTTEFMPGKTVRHIAEDGSQELRDRVGVSIFRFTLGTAFSYGMFNTDPHPGNYVVLDDGRTAFLDFGSVKFLPDDLRKDWRAVATALVHGRVEEWRALNAALLGMEHMDPRARELHQEYQLYTAAVVAENREVMIDKHLLRDAVEKGMSTAKKVIREVGILPSKSKTLRLRPDFLMIGRLQVGLFAVLATLRCKANWNQILREMLVRSK